MNELQKYQPLGYSQPEGDALVELKHLFAQLQEATGSELGRLLDTIAYVLLNRLTLYAGRQRYRLTEIEFYYRRRDGHDDPYVHGGPQQRESGTWFYNLAGGVDLTCGDATTGTEGGILLRGLRCLDAEPPTFVSGVQLVMRELVSALGSAFAPNSGWHLQSEAAPTEHPVWKSRRVGLPEKEDTVAADFWQRKYRYLSDVEYVRGLSGKEALVREWVQEGQIVWQDVATMLGYRPGWLA